MNDLQKRLAALEQQAKAKQDPESMTDAELEAFLASDMPSWDVLRALSDTDLQLLADGDSTITATYKEKVAQRRQDHYAD